jgi:hypothetical protein
MIYTYIHDIYTQTYTYIEVQRDLYREQRFIEVQRFIEAQRYRGS